MKRKKQRNYRKHGTITLNKEDIILEKYREREGKKSVN